MFHPGHRFTEEPMQYSRKASAIALALFLPLASSLAQPAPKEEPKATKEEPSKWALSIGAEPSSLNTRVVGNLTRIWQAPDSRYSRHISLMLGADAPHTESVQNWYGPESCSACATRITNSYAGLTAGGSADLFHLWRFTPYLQGGAGVYYSKFSREPVDGVVLRSSLNSFYTNSEFSVGLNAGLGIKARLGSHEFFVEQIVHTFDFYPVGRGVRPLNFGIRF